MAKSMRSKIKRRFRSIKRQAVFAPIENARTQRLATRLANSSLINSEPPEQPLSRHKTESVTIDSTDLTSGSLCYEILGLIDPEIIDSTNIEGLMSVMSGVLGDSF
jgi:hypothetical protein